MIWVCKSLRYEREDLQETKYSGSLNATLLLPVFVFLLYTLDFLYYYDCQDWFYAQSSLFSSLALAFFLLLVIILISSLSFSTTDGQKRGNSTFLTSSLSLCLSDMRKVLTFPKFKFVGCWFCLFLKVSQSYLALEVEKLWFRCCLLTIGNSFMLFFALLYANLLRISFSEHLQVLGSMLEEDRYLIQLSGILLILLLCELMRSMRQGSSCGRGTWRLSNCLRIEPGLVEDQSGES